LVQVYPEYKLNRIYGKGQTYQNRVKALQMTHGLGRDLEIRAPDLEEPVNTYRVKDKKLALT
jgi:hypothetical protein